MKLRQNDTLQALRRIQGFLDTYASVLGTIPTGGVRKDLDASVAALTAHAVAQQASKQGTVGATSKLKSLRTALLQGNMAPIATIAAAKITLTPELKALTMPKPDIHSQALITAATAMGNTAAPFAATFTGQGLAADFLTQLQAAASALQAGIDSRSAVKTNGVAATTGAQSEIVAARAVIKQLNALVVAQIANTNPTLLSAWTNTKKITAKGGVPLGSTQTLTLTPAPAVALLASPPSTPAAPAATSAAATAS